jgi:DNA repair protein RadC
LIYTIKLKTFTIKVREPKRKNKVVSNSEQAARIIRCILKNLDADQEYFVALFTDSRNRIRYYKVLFSGCQNSADVDLKILFRNALLCGAMGMITAHNHPSGDVTPSKEDVELNHQIRSAAKLLGINLLDNLIVTKSSHYSFADKGLILT